MGKGKGSGMGSGGSSNKFVSTTPVLQRAATNVLQTKCHPSIAAPVDKKNTGRINLRKEDLLKWFKSDQAQEWTTAVGVEQHQTQQQTRINPNHHSDL